MTDKDLYGGLIRLHILHHAAEEPVFGLGIIEELRRHGYEMSAGTVYPMLHGLENFKALTYNQWLLVGRKTFDSMGVLPNRKYAVVSKNGISSSNENVLVFPSIENALKELSKVTDHVYVSGGGQIYNSLIEKADIIHLSTVHVEVEGDIKFPIMPENFNLVFEQFFMSNINYTYQIWKKG